MFKEKKYKTLDEVIESGCHVYGYCQREGNQLQFSSYMCIKRCTFDGTSIKVVNGYSNFPVDTGIAICDKIMRLYTEKYGECELYMFRERVCIPELKGYSKSKEYFMDIEYLKACSPKACEDAIEIHKQLERELSFANVKFLIENTLEVYRTVYGDTIGIEVFQSSPDDYSDIVITGENVGVFWEIYQKLEKISNLPLKF